MPYHSSVYLCKCLISIGILPKNPWTEIFEIFVQDLSKLSKPFVSA